jgi:hypothetical protein
MKGGWAAKCPMNGNSSINGGFFVAMFVRLY